MGKYLREKALKQGWSKYLNLIGKMTPEKSDGKYRFCKKINRLQWEYQIRSLFKNEYRRKGNQYYGKLEVIKETEECRKMRGIKEEIPVKISFSIDRPCVLCTKDKEDLEIIFRKVLDALSGK